MQIIQDQQLTTCSLRGKMFSRHCTELGQPTCVCGGVKWIECVQPAPRPPSDGGGTAVCRHTQRHAFVLGR